MDIQVSLSVKANPQNLLLGRLVDLQTLVGILDGAWEDMTYRLEKAKGKKNLYYFVEDPTSETEAIYALVQLEGSQVYASSPMVHNLIMDAYHRYVEEFGEIPLEN